MSLVVLAPGISYAYRFLFAESGSVLFEDLHYLAGLAAAFLVLVVITTSTVKVVIVAIVLGVAVVVTDNVIIIATIDIIIDNVVVQNAVHVVTVVNYVCVIALRLGSVWLVWRVFGAFSIHQFDVLVGGNAGFGRVVLTLILYNRVEKAFQRLNLPTSAGFVRKQQVVQEPGKH